MILLADMLKKYNNGIFSRRQKHSAIFVILKYGLSIAKKKIHFFAKWIEKFAHEIGVYREWKLIEFAFY